MSTLMSGMIYFMPVNTPNIGISGQVDLIINDSVSKHTGQTSCGQKADDSIFCRHVIFELGSSKKRNFKKSARDFL